MKELKKWMHAQFMAMFDIYNQCMHEFIEFMVFK